MTSSDPTPKLPLWIFFVADAALLGAAVFIARETARPLSNSAIVSIVTCVLAGALVVLVPLVIYFERQKNEALDERQRALEALARTITSAAEQISIAAGGFHGIAELAQKNLRQAEHLPHKLQEKIAEFQAQLNNATDAEKEELESELVALRTTESERLQAISDKIAKTVSEFAKIEAATHQHLTSAHEAVAKLAAGAATIGKAQAAAEQALAQIRTEAAREIADSTGTAARTINSAKSVAIAEIEAKFAGAGAAVVERIAHEIAKFQTAAAAAIPPAAQFAEKPSATQDFPTAPELASDAAPSPKAESTAHPPKRPRKPRRDDLAADSPEEDKPAVATDETTPPAEVPVTPIGEPPPISTDKIPEITPVVPSTDAPFPAGHDTAPAEVATQLPAVAPAPTEALPSSDASKAPRKRPAKKSEPEMPADLDLGLEDSSSPVSGSGERVLTSDGATRLIVTAYIGIGNRLFIRGEGAGLSWEKGVPLQFISIGKWRWETNDAHAPVQFKLYKNDEIECAALGLLSVEPGYQQEVAAAF